MKVIWSIVFWLMWIGLVFLVFPVPQSPWGLLALFVLPPLFFSFFRKK